MATRLQRAISLLFFFSLLVVVQQHHLGSVWASPNEDVDLPTLKVVFCGLGRTGSHSLAESLTRLGYTPCHGSDIITNIVGSHKAMADGIQIGDLSGTLQETARLGYDATLEGHAGLCSELFRYRQTLAPDVKFIFSVRDFEPWYDSMKDMRQAVKPLNRYPLRLIPMMEAQFQWSSQAALLFGDATGDERFTPKQFIEDLDHPVIKGYHQQLHQRNRDFSLEATANEPEHAFRLDYRELNERGYQPLCDFLGMDDCPDESYPRLGSSNHFQTIRIGLLVFEALLYAILLGVAYGLSMFVVR
jgi:hypothetical protein